MKYIHITSCMHNIYFSSQYGRFYFIADVNNRDIKIDIILI